ncbi:SDR family NAD(P)-dependent oxidoreductase [bacterium]|jgi:short-subunit dehydrogenase|nr:SDR family NAD(P)-dependent oxidoreductase [bacterium]MBT6293490.1 SDR family NAD(P)-dependent oxidoreductase [bacterium]
MFDFKNKTVLITGASGNLGSTLSKSFARAGANLVLAGRSLESLKSLQAELNELEVKSLILEVDVKDFSKCQNIVDKSLSEFGNIDIVVNTASDCLIGWDLTQITVDQIDAEIHTTYRSIVYMTKLVLPYMLERQSGTIVNVSSVSAVNEGSCPVYSADKAAVIRFTETMQENLATKNVNMVCVVPPNIRFKNFVEEKGVSFQDVANVIMMQCLESDNLSMPVVYLKPRAI